MGTYHGTGNQASYNLSMSGKSTDTTYRQTKTGTTMTSIPEAVLQTTSALYTPFGKQTYSEGHAYSWHPGMKLPSVRPTAYDGSYHFRGGNH